jgi:hypothetical protein
MLSDNRNFPSKVEKLTALSDKHAFSVFDRVTYPESLEPGLLQFPEECLSLYHHPIYATLSDEQKWQLSLLEMVNFFSINIHGERALVRDLVGRLYRNKGPLDSNDTSRYLQHFIHEENAHTFMLAGYCVRYAGQVFPDLSTAFQTSSNSPLVADLLFFGRVFLLETFLGFLNRKAMQDDTLDPTARRINYLHHFDETRHIAFDRAALAELSERLVLEAPETDLAPIRAQLNDYAEYTVKRLCNPAVYRKLGIPDGVRIAEEVRALPERRLLVDKWLKQGRTSLAEMRLG